MQTKITYSIKKLLKAKLPFLAFFLFSVLALHAETENGLNARNTGNNLYNSYLSYPGTYKGTNILEGKSASVSGAENRKGGGFSRKNLPPGVTITYPTPNVYIQSVSVVTLSPTVSGGSVSAYSISPALPSGLSFNANTGVITGTPIVASSNTTYTVTGVTAGGNVTTTFAITVTTNIFNNSFSNVNFGDAALGVTITPKVGTGTTAGDKVLYQNVATIGGQQIDAIVTTEAISNATFNTYDQTAASGTGYSSNEQRFFSPQFNFSGSGNIVFYFQFILGGTYNNTTNTGSAAVLQNVRINTYDIDGNGGTNSNQFNEFGGFTTSELGSSSPTVAATYNFTSRLTKFRSTTTVNSSVVIADPTRVRVTYGSISDFRISVGAEGSGLAYFFLDFGTGSTFNSTQSSAPSLDLNTGTSGIDNNGATCNTNSPFSSGSNNVVSGADINNMVLRFPTANITNGASEQLIINGATSGGTIALNFANAASISNVVLGGVTYTVAATVSGGFSNLTFTPSGGGTVTVAQTEALIDAFNYKNTASSPTTGSRVFGVTIVSGAFASPEAFYTATVSCVFNIAGTVFNDLNGGTVNGTGTNAAAGYVSLVNGSTVIATVPVNSDGTYLFTGVSAGTYDVVLHNTAAGSNTAAVASGWVNTGEGIGATPTASDGSINGRVTVVVASNVTNVNLGVEQPPTAGTASAASQVNPGGTNSVAAASTLFSGTDPSSGSIASLKITSFPTNATSITINGTSYTSLTFPGAGVTLTTNADGSLASGQTVSVDPVDGAVSSVISYTVTDAAGFTSSNTGTATLPFTTVSVSGTVFNDINGGTVNGTGSNAGATYVSLVSGGSTVVATQPVASDGTYTFTGVNAGSYTVVLHTTAAGSSTAAVNSGWVNTGEGVGATPTTADGTVNGITAVTVSSGNVTNVNFGVEQTPTAGTASAASQVNPGGTNSVAASSTLFSGTDPSSGSIASLKITSFPTNATSITINGTSYTSLTFPGGGVTLTTNADGSLASGQTVSVDPVDGVVSVVISYTVTDNAGFTSSNTGSATLPFTAALVPPVATNNSGSTTGTDPVTLNAVTDGTPDSDVDGTVDASTVDLDPSAPGRQTTASTADGEWSVDNAGNVTFTPNSGFSGTAVLPYTVKDNDGLTSNTATISIDVKIPPVATNNSGSTTGTDPVTLNAVTDGTPDSDVDGTVDVATVDLDPSTPGRQTTASTADGEWSVDNAGNVTFTPNSGFSGTATLPYTVKDNDGLTSNTATISIDVKIPPVATNNSGSTTGTDPVTLNAVTDGTPDSDVDGTVDVATVDLDPSAPGRQTTASTADGEWSVDNAGNVTFTPNSGFSGTAVLPYTVKDNDGLTSNTATISIDVKIPPVATNNSGSTTGTDPVTLNAVTDGTPDSDVDGTVDASTVDLDPSAPGRQTTASTADGEWSVDNAGNVTFTPNSGFSGTATLPYTVKDNDGLTSNTAIISIDVKIPPVATNNSTTTNQNTPVTLNVVTDGTPDSDVDGTVDASTVDLDPSAPGRQTTASTADGEWSVDNAGNVTFTPAPNFSGIATLPYSVKDNDGLSSNNATITVTVNKVCTIIATAVSNKTGCFGSTDGSVAAIVSGGSGSYSYLWSNGAITKEVFNLSRGKYSVTVTDNNTGCTSISEVCVLSPSKVRLELTISKPAPGVKCGTSANAYPSKGVAPYTFLWNDGVTTSSRTGLCQGKYRVTVTDANGCTASEQFTLGPCRIYINTIVKKDATCGGAADGVFSMQATGAAAPYTYTWPDGYIGAYRSGLLAGNYDVTVKDATGCTVLFVAEIKSNCDICIVGGDDPIARNDEFSVNQNAVVAGNVSVNDIPTNSLNVWSRISNPAFGSVVFQSNGSFSYTPNIGFTGTDVFTYQLCDNGGNCTEAVATITVNPSTCNLSASLVTVNPTCNKLSGSLTAVVNGGSGSYSYTWSNGSTAASASGLTEGNYTVVITDNVSGCKTSAIGCITNPELLKAKITITNNGNSCTTGVSVTPTKGTAPFTYYWNDGSKAQSRTNLCAGPYNVRVTDSKGCVFQKQFTIGECSINVNVIALVNATCTQPNSGRINVSATGGTGPYTYTWLDGATGPLRTGLAAGNYSGTVMDATGCTAPIGFEIKNDCDPCSRRNAKLGTNNIIPSTASKSSVTTQFSALSLKAMPNPANGRTTISIQSNKSTSGTLSLVDINGKVFSNQTIAINAGVTTIKMNLLGAAQGVYLVRLVTEGATQSIKLIVE